MALIAVFFLLPATIFMEPNVLAITVTLAREDKKIICFLLFNSSMAYFVNLTNFLVTKHTSALTLQVLGNVKGAVAVVISILIFRNPVSLTGMLGYAVLVHPCKLGFSFLSGFQNSDKKLKYGLAFPRFPEL
ncbi:probable sugar phosphate/phosphate translocator At3g11320 [Dioscorea cayenensis subsp. rotundata]|uniref:Probable sugar phosphate/phosphate translocator At3g11320 n=1 Tax=Dioscorea cayennensis subsp. rotundata TaxID=55577 RepID=A0AB40AJF8_DIOCR|nr:probable sugar phosphate/phosphate translocator At3g11320 [Dioscorea cayenensis subsp. rotundata]